MVSSWQNPAFTDAGFEDLLVIGVADTNETRRLYEDTFSRVFVSEGARSQPSYRLLPQSGPLSEEQIRGAMEGGGFDGVLITTLVSVDEQREFVPPPEQQNNRPASNVGPGGQMNVRTSPGGVGYFQSYSRSYSATHIEGYYKTDTTYRFTTELYSGGTGTMVWRGESETVNPKNRADKVGSVAEAVVRELKSEKLLQ